jgi:hypothetical protein
VATDSPGGQRPEESLALPPEVARRLAQAARDPGAARRPPRAAPVPLPPGLLTAPFSTPPEGACAMGSRRSSFHGTRYRPWPGW